MNLLEKIISQYIAPYLKAHVAGLGAGLSVLAADANGNLNNLGSLSLNQWLAAVAATGLLGSLTGFVGNRPAAADAPAPVVAEQDAGNDVPAASPDDPQA